MAWYSGKHTDRLDLKIGSYTKYAQSRWAPGGNCSLQLMLYANITYTLKPGYLTGVLRIRSVRETNPQDPTAYQDFTFTRQNAKVDLKALAKASPPATWLITHMWMGGGTKGLAMHWEFRPGVEFASAFVTTRYAKAEIS